MRLVYNSPQYAIYAFAREEAFELVSKRCHSMAFVQGGDAHRFNAAIRAVAEEDDDAAHIDAFLDDFTEGRMRPFQTH